MQVSCLDLSPMLPALRSQRSYIHFGDTVDGCEIRFSHHFETMVETITFAGIHRGTESFQGVSAYGPLPWSRDVP